jgi:V/A-type H+/Na+-transporting ATPase subunit F
MYRFIVITDPESATGFRLAGAEVLEAESAIEASVQFSEVIVSEDAGIIAIREDYLADIDPKLYERIERCYHPIVIPIPAPRNKERAGSYVEKLLRRAIGYNVVMRS